jgi:hypothetical protein
VKSALRWLALAVLLVAVGYWLAAGANRGWDKNKVPIKTVDAVTGIENVTYQKKFIPGAEFLAKAATASVLVAACSFLIRTKRLAETSNEQTHNPK